MKAFIRIHLGLFLLLSVCGCSKSDSSSNSKSPASTSVADGPKTTEGQSAKPSFYTVDHYDNARNPTDDLAATVTQAKAENKRILLDVGSDWCGWCKLMSHFIETNDKVRDNILNNYLVMKVTWDSDNKNLGFLSQYPAIPGYPHLFVLDSDGKLLHSQPTRELEQGHGYNETAYLDFLNKWKPAH
jgi:thioredoxin-related protein